MTDFKPGDLISYQNPGMDEPKHGIYYTTADTPGYAFIRFHSKRAELTALSFCKPGHVGPWYFEDADGKWYDLS